MERDRSWDPPMEDRETRWTSTRQRPPRCEPPPVDGFEILIHAHAQELESGKGTRNADYP